MTDPTSLPAGRDAHAGTHLPTGAPMTALSPAPDLSPEEAARLASWEAREAVDIAEDVREEALLACAAWLESLASPTLAGDPFIRAADWAARLVREFATRSTPLAGQHTTDEEAHRG